MAVAQFFVPPPAQPVPFRLLATYMEPISTTSGYPHGVGVGVRIGIGVRVGVRVGFGGLED